MTTQQFSVEYLTVQLWQDSNSPSPRTWDNFAKLCLLHDRMLINETDITLPNDVTPFTVRPLIEARYEPAVLLPVWFYDHSGMSVKAGDRPAPFNDRWDSGLFGWAFVPYTDFINFYENDTQSNREDAARRIQDEVETLSMWLTDQVYGYDVLANGVIVDSQGDYYGLETCEEQAREAAEVVIASGKYAPTLTVVGRVLEIESLEQAPTEALADAIKEAVTEARAALQALEVVAEANTAAKHIWACYQNAQGIAAFLLSALEAIERGVRDANNQ